MYESDLPPFWPQWRSAQPLRSATGCSAAAAAALGWAFKLLYLIRIRPATFLAAVAKRAAIAQRGGLFRTSSSRSGLGFGGAGWARSRYEEAQILQRLQALERMRTMCQVGTVG